MKVRKALWILLASTTALASMANDGADSSNAGRSISIEPAKTRFVLGGPIDLRIVYSNPTGEPWKLEQPESSAGVKVWYEPVGKGESTRMGFSFSRVTAKGVRLPDGRRQIVHTAPPKIEMSIPPGAKHEVTVDIYSKWTEDLAPGEYEVWVEDVTQKLKSNRAAFSLAFTRDSIPPLLATAASEQEIPAKRRWCVSWLKQIQPDFELRVKDVKDTPQAAKQIEDDNAAAVRGFKEGWEKIKDSREIEALFTKPTPHPRGGQQQQPPSPPRKDSP